MGEPILFKHKCAAGDVVAMTACIRDLAITYPDKYDIHIWTTCGSLWDNNPHIVKQHAAPPPPSKIKKQISLTYGHHINKANRCKRHFLTAFHENIYEQLKVRVPVLQAHGDLHLDDWHKENSPIDGRYWYIITGGKSDFTTKVWSAVRFQQTINILRQHGVRFVQDGALHQGHWQPPMEGVLSTVNKTSLRDMLWLIYHSDGVICTITAAMHMAAAFGKPCVITAGGREHWWWEAYTNVILKEQFGPKCVPLDVEHRYLHTQGLLDCCLDRGCWKNKVTKKERDKHKSYCKKPTTDGYGQDIPECLDMLKVEHVVEAVMSYYEEGTLPPIGEPRQIINQDGKVIVPGTLSEKPVEAAEPPSAGFVDLFAIQAPGGTPGIASTNQLPPPPTVPMMQNAFEQKPKPEPVVQHTFEKVAADPNLAAGDPFDHPAIGGRVTICVLLYGDYPDMHKQCINAIISTVPASRMQLRVGCNEVCDETLRYVSRLENEGRICHTLISPQNIKKYPMMRSMFHNEVNPIEDKYVIWFDDDSIANRDMQWCQNLVMTIGQNHDKGKHMYGATHLWNFHLSQINWIRSRPWYKERPFQMKNGVEEANGRKVAFPTGGFWAMSMEAIRAAQVPDPDIGNNGGDYMIAEQVWQNGFGLKDWNRNKKHVFTSSVKRRGLSEEHTGMPGWKPGGNTK